MAKVRTKKRAPKLANTLEVSIDASSIESAIKRAVVNTRWAKAFNDWMQDFVNNPEKFTSTTAGALKFLRDRSVGREPTYGEECAVCFQAYLDRQN